MPPRSDSLTIMRICSCGPGGQTSRHRSSVRDALLVCSGPSTTWPLSADRAGDEDQSVLITREEFEMLGQTELVHRLHLCVNDAKNEIDPEPLAGNAGAIPAECIRVGKIRVAPLVQMRFVQAGKKTFCERERQVRGETRSVGPNRLQRSVQPPQRRRVYAKMNIRRAGTLSDGQVFIDMRQRMRLGRCRCWGHGVPRFLCSATARVNSKGFRPGTAA